MTRRALLISPHFPPDSSAATHRVRLLAPHLAAHGWSPTVLTVEADAHEGRLDPDLLALVPPDLRVERAPAWPASLTRRVGVGDLGLRALAGLRQRAEALLVRERFDVLFITTYPIYPALLGPWLRRRHRMPFVLDVQDPWVGAWGRTVGVGRDGGPDPRSRAARRVATWIEWLVVPRADGLTAVSARTWEDMRGRVPALPAVRVELPLGFEPGDVAWLRAHPRAVRLFDPSDGGVHLLSVGTILPTSGPVVHAVLAGLRRLVDADPSLRGRLRWHVVGSSNQRRPGQPPRVQPLAREYGLEDIVAEVPERVDYLEALALQQRARVILLLGSPEPHYTPSKVYPAYLSGRPLLGVYHEASSVVPFLRACPGARVVTLSARTPPEALAIETADALRAVLSSPADHAWPRDARQMGEWAASAVAARLAGVFDEVAGGARVQRA